MSNNYDNFNKNNKTWLKLYASKTISLDREGVKMRQRQNKKKVENTVHEWLNYVFNNFTDNLSYKSYLLNCASVTVQLNVVLCFLPQSKLHYHLWRINYSCVAILPLTLITCITTCT